MTTQPGIRIGTKTGTNYKYLLMRHEREGVNSVVLMEGARVCETVADSIDIVQLDVGTGTIDDQRLIEARQLHRLRDSLTAIGNTTFRDVDSARKEALLTLRHLSTYDKLHRRD